MQAHGNPPSAARHDSSERLRFRGGKCTSRFRRRFEGPIGKLPRHDSYRHSRARKWIRRDDEARAVQTDRVDGLVRLHILPAVAECERCQIPNPYEGILAEQFFTTRRTREVQILTTGSFHLTEERCPRGLRTKASIDV